MDGQVDAEVRSLPIRNLFEVVPGYAPTADGSTRRSTSRRR